MSEATVSEEQVLHNELSFEINQELIHLMKRIVEIQRVNKQLKEVIEEVREYIEENRLYNYEYDEEELFEIITDKKARKELLQILDKVKGK